MNTSTEPPRQRPEAELADRLHSAAIHLLRRLRVHDQASGLTGPRLSALSVVVFAGPLSMGDLAAAEQVRPPTVSRMIRELEVEGLVRRVADPSDGRVLMVEATAEGVRILQEGRRRRVEALAVRIADLGAEEREVLERAAQTLERLALPASHPGRG